MPREVTPGFYWLQECGPDRRHFLTDDETALPDWYESGRAVHIPQNAYVLVGDETTLLFDTLSPASTEAILEQLDACLDGRSLDYLVVSHPDIPHAGNAPAILETYPEAELVGPRYGTGHELYHLDDAMQVGDGDTIDLGGLTVEFHPPSFPDAAVHLWMTEQTTGTLFPVDWLGYPHMTGECLQFADEFETNVDHDRLRQFHGRVLFWYQYVDVERVKREIDWIIDRYDPAILAPGHGNVIRSDTIEHMNKIKAVVDTIRDDGRVGTLG